MSDPTLPSNEEQREAEIFNHKQTVAELLEISPEEVVFEKMGEKFERRGFYNYFFTEGEKESFVKTARKTEANVQLRREAASSEIAKRFDIPIKKSVPLKGAVEFENYVESEGIGVLAQELLSSEEWTFLVTPGMIESVDEETAHAYGNTLAKIAMTKLGRELPSDVSIESLITANNRYQSPGTFEAFWQTSGDIVINGLDAVYPNSEEEKVKIAGLVSEVRERMRYLLDNSPSSEQTYYFVHGDFDANNICLKPTEGEYRVLDFEYAGATKHQPLARLTDISNCFGRCRPNQMMQESFIRECMQHHEEKSPQDAYHLLRSAIIFGTIHLAKFAMDPNHNEHIRAKQQLKQLDENLSILDQEYLKIISET